MLNFVEKWYKKLTKTERYTLVATFIIGIITHIYKFTNMIPNFDGLSEVYSKQNLIVSGRWFLVIPCEFSSSYDISWIIGLFSVVYISIATFFVVRLFKIQKVGTGVLIGGLMVTFPSVAATFFYEYTADGYFFGLMLSCIAVYLSNFSNKKIINNIISIILMTFTCGIYQCYYSFGVALALVYFIYITFENNNSVKNLFIYAAKQAAIYISSFVLYYIIWKILLKLENATVTSYLGINDIKLSFDNIIACVKNAVHMLLFFFFEGHLSTSNPSVYALLNGLFLVFLFIGVVIAFIKNKTYKSFSRILLIILPALLFFPVIFMWGIVSSEVEFGIRMLGGIVFLFIFSVIIYDKYLNLKMKNIYSVCISGLIITYAVSSNIGYLILERDINNSYVTATEIIYDIDKMSTKYDFDKIAVIGHIETTNIVITDDGNQTDLNKENSILFCGNYDNYILNNNKLLYAYEFMRNYCGCQYESVSFDEIDEYCQMDEVKSMKCWPDEEGMKIIGDVLVVKIGDTNKIS